ncbi:transposase [Methylobacterium phyllosphaerae]|uniref:Transposase n=1 Tax=Methylobacterium phyllosphaerae TaxID=418223 RepID=A0AAE8L845_9HYPH|nr:transposase [Methylobacterium phyllosphaerae]SFH31608.1 transposase [Methylobacterium phyllosphaerae]
MADRKQTFTPEFRAEAVRLAQTSGRSRREVAADLGVGLSTLRNWIDGRREREMELTRFGGAVERLRIRGW